MASRAMGRERKPAPRRRRPRTATKPEASRQDRRPAPKNGRLHRDDWIAAGQVVLCEVGIAGLRLSVLTRRLHVSTGSFYHHFAHMEDYLAALASHFSQDVILRGSAATRSFSACYLRGGELIAIDTVNQPKDQMAARKLIAAHARPDPDKLADAAIALRDTL